MYSRFIVQPDVVFWPWPVKKKGEGGYMLDRFYSLFAVDLIEICVFKKHINNSKYLWRKLAHIVEDHLKFLVLAKEAIVAIWKKFAICAGKHKRILIIFFED